jgi:hypothetical protein
LGKKIETGDWTLENCEFRKNSLITSIINPLPFDKSLFSNAYYISVKGSPKKIRCNIVKMHQAFTPKDPLQDEISYITCFAQKLAGQNKQLYCIQNVHQFNAFYRYWHGDAVVLQRVINEQILKSTIFVQKYNTNNVFSQSELEDITSWLSYSDIWPIIR